MKDHRQHNIPGNLSPEARKKGEGRFFTVTNPFNIGIFHQWLSLMPESARHPILEPFAGSNNIVKMLHDLGFNFDWVCFDLQPGANIWPACPIRTRDTLRDFPKGYATALTNPPYLAKNSATRNRLPYPDTTYDDLYKYCLDIMLSHLAYVGAIIPESFINAGLFHERLHAFVSLPCKMFEDTDCPVCLALFIPAAQKPQLRLAPTDFLVYSADRLIGRYLQLTMRKPLARTQANWVFNDPGGDIGIRCVDNTVEASIKFVHGHEIDPDKIKVSSRSLTRVSGLPSRVALPSFLDLCNSLLEEYRKTTSDIFLTSFKGLRKDSKYRRRLDFANARMIMNSALGHLQGGNANDQHVLGPM